MISLRFIILVLFVCIEPAIWASGSVPPVDPNCASPLQSPSKWVQQRTSDVVRLNSRLNELSRLTAPGEADQTIVIYDDETDTGVRIMGLREISQIQADASLRQAEPIVRATRRAVEFRIKSAGAFEGLIHFLTDDAHATLASYLRKLNVGRITAILASPAGTGRIHIELYEKSADGHFKLNVGGQWRGYVMRDPKYLREILVAYAQNLDHLDQPVFDHAERKIDHVNRTFAIDLNALDLARLGTAHQLTSDILYYLGLRFDPFNTNGSYFLQRSVDDGIDWARDRIRIARKIGSALDVLQRERFIYVNHNARVESRRALPVGWLTSHAYFLTWETKGFDGFLRADHRGKIDGMDVSLASAEAILKVQALGFHWNESAQKFVR